MSSVGAGARGVLGWVLPELGGRRLLIAFAVCAVIFPVLASGKVVTPKTPIPGMGAYARIADTEGNTIGLFETA